MQAVYEADFKGFSYGFRPGRSQHDALDALAVGIHGRVGWVLDVDIRAFFDTIDRLAQPTQDPAKHVWSDTRHQRMPSRCHLGSRRAAEP